MREDYPVLLTIRAQEFVSGELEQRHTTTTTSNDLFASPAAKTGKRF